MAADRQRTASKGEGHSVSRKAEHGEAGAKKIAGAKLASTEGRKKASGSYILSAPNGPRTVSHKRIKDAVEKVFRERLRTNG